MKSIGWILAIVALPLMLALFYFKSRGDVAEKAAQAAKDQAQAAALANAQRGPAFPGQPGAPGVGDYAAQIAGRVGGSVINSALEIFGL